MAMRRADMTRAYGFYRESIGAWSDSPLFWCGLAILYFQNDQLNDATVALQRAIQMRIDTAECWFDLGLIHELQGETEKAMRVYATGLQLCNGPQLLRERFEALRLR
jgi:Flp pilus assembly protein TadD